MAYHVCASAYDAKSEYDRAISQQGLATTCKDRSIPRRSANQASTVMIAPRRLVPFGVLLVRPPLRISTLNNYTKNEKKVLVFFCKS
jgi:hypothetical protein